jgi:uncharacterized protein (TIGR03435 family)
MALSLLARSAVFPALALFVSLASSAFAQDPFYEVASIKPNTAGGRSTWGVIAGGRLTATNMTLKGLMQFAWNVRDYQVSGGPGWAGSEGFDIVATPDRRIDPTQATIDIHRGMLRKLLTGRFGLAIDRRQRDMPIYALVVARDGAKIRAVEKPEHPADMRTSAGPGSLTVQKLNMNLFTQQIVRDIVGRPVVDKTGLTGYYDFKLEWNPDDSAQVGPNDRPSIFTALQEQLGLRLDGERGPVDVLTITHAEIPSNLDPQ